MDNLISTRLGKYEIQTEIGRGGMGTVYKGYDPLLDRHVAVKVLAPHLVWDREFVERFLREARAAARLKHPNIVTIHDVGPEGGRYYFVMEYLEGQSLAAIIRQQGPLPFDRILSILRPLAQALDYAHHRGLVHRDVKPSNVIIGPAGQVTLTDFGIARAAQETRLTATGMAVGTPEYMSPQQAKGLAVDARSDQYSLAVVAYEMLSGQVPFQAESTLALLYKVVHEPPPPIRQVQPSLPPGVERVLEKALAKEPGDRYATIGAFVDALEQALLGEEVGKALTPPEPAPPPAEEEPTVVRTPEEATTLQPVTFPPPALPEVPVIAPAAHPAPTPRRVPGWIWALGGLAVLALVLGVVMGIGERKRSIVGSTPTAAVATAEEKSTPHSTASPATISPHDNLLGPYLFFVSNRDGKWEVYRLTRTGKAERITHTPGQGESWSPVLVPDGSILFTSDRDGKREIYHLTTTGKLERITYTPGQDESWSPALAPDGSILFTSDRDGKQEIYCLTTAGKVERITHTPGQHESWSPIPVADGTVLFTSNRDGKREVYHLTGTGKTERVTHTPGQGESWSPAVAPDGSLLFASNRDGKQEIYHLTTTGKMERITYTPGQSESWSPTPVADGTILFTSNRDGKQEIYRLTGAGEVEQITYTPSDNGSWLSD